MMNNAYVIEQLTVIKFSHFCNKILIVKILEFYIRSGWKILFLFISKNKRI